VITARKISSGPDVLGVLLTSKCNISCRHCCNDSHPQHSGAVSFEDIAQLIEGARGIPSISEIGISGGEPFLFLPLLHRVIQFATGCGFTSSVTTNGFWGTAAGARRILQDLKTSGLRAVCVSTSGFHQEFIQLNAVIGAAKAALIAGLDVTINLVSSASLSTDSIRTALGDLAGRIELVIMPCLPAGRAADHIHAREYLREFAVPYGNCRQHFRKMAVDIAGDVYPCCSPGGFTTPLKLGNAKNASLRSILDNSASSKLLAILESVGPSFFLPFLRAAAVEPMLPERFSDQCHLCHEMLSSDKCAQTIRSATEKLFSELAAINSADVPTNHEMQLTLAPAQGH
jgi:MoaA/NifB/PqqE/SkfB family radical SAM enzyme